MMASQKPKIAVVDPRCCFRGGWPHGLTVLIVEVRVLFTGLMKLRTAR